MSPRGLDWTAGCMRGPSAELADMEGETGMWGNWQVQLGRTSLRKGCVGRPGGIVQPTIGLEGWGWSYCYEVLPTQIAPLPHSFLLTLLVSEISPWYQSNSFQP